MTHHYKELCIFNSPFTGQGLVGWGGDSGMLPVMAQAPGRVYPIQNGSLKVKALSGAGAIRLHLITVFRGAVAWARTTFICLGDGVGMK